MSDCYPALSVFIFICMCWLTHKVKSCVFLQYPNHLILTPTYNVMRPSPQRRTLGDIDFYRNWTAYADGFGDVTGDHWLGLDNIHGLCNEVSGYDIVLVRLNVSGGGAAVEEG